MERTERLRDIGDLEDGLVWSGGESWEFFLEIWD
jgi:hypothetical protein